MEIIACTCWVANGHCEGRVNTKFAPFPQCCGKGCGKGRFTVTDHDRLQYNWFPSHLQPPSLLRGPSEAVTSGLTTGRLGVRRKLPD